jgi:hypothetical protein
MERVDIARALIERWNRGERDMSEVAQWLDPEIELESPFASVAGEPYRGRTGIESWQRELDDQFSEWTIDPEELREVGRAVLAISQVRARGRTSGVELAFRAAATLRFSERDAVTHVRIYLDVDEALEAPE